MPIYLLIDGANGGSTDAGYPGWFEIESVALEGVLEVVNGFPGARSLSDVSVSMSGVASALLGILSRGLPINSVRIREEDSAGNLTYDLLLGSVRVTNTVIVAANGTPSTRLSFDYDRIGLTTPDGSFGYDLVRGVEIAADAIPAPASRGADMLQSAPATEYFLLFKDGTAATAWFKIESFEFAAETPPVLGVGGGVGARAPSFSDVAVRFSGVSTDLLGRLTAGTAIDSVQVQGLNSAGQVVYDLRLDQAFVKGGSIGANGDTPVSNLSFGYERLGLLTPDSRFGHDVVANESFDPSSLTPLVKSGPDAVESAAVTRYYLAIDGYNGGESNGQTTGWFKIDSFDFDVTAVGRPSFSDLSVSLPGLSPALLAALATETNIRSVKLQGVDASGTAIYTLHLGNVLVSSHSIGSGGEAPSTRLSFSYEQVKLSTLGPTPTTGPSFSYDTTTNLPVSTPIAEPVPAGPDALESGAVTQYFLVIQDGTAAAAWLSLDAVQLDADLFAGMRNFSDLEVDFTGVAPDLLSKLAAITRIDSVQVQGVNSAGNVVYDLRLADAVVTGHLVNTDDSTPVSRVSFGYDRIALITPASSFGYDLRSNATIDPASLASLTRSGPDAVESGAVINYFMAIDGFNGGASNGSTTGWFDIDSLKFELTTDGINGLYSTPIASDVTVSMVGISPALLTRLTGGTAIPSVQVQGVNEQGAVVYDLKLGSVFLKDNSFSSTTGDAPTTSLSFAYGAINLNTPAGNFAYSQTGGSTSIPAPRRQGGDVLETGAASRFFLTIDGIGGGSAATSPSGPFEISSLRVGSSYSLDPDIEDPRVFSDVVVSLQGISPDLLDALTNLTNLDSVRVEGVDSTGNRVYDLRLADAFLTNYDIGSAGGPSASLAFDYKRIGLITDAGKFGWDLTADRSLDPTLLPIPPVGLPPIVTQLTATVGEDGPAFSQNLLGGASDPDAGTTLAVTDLSNSVTTTDGRVLTLGTDYTLTGSTLTLTPAGFAKFNSLGASESDEATIAFKVSDGLLSTANTLKLTINGLNDAATISGTRTGAVTENGTLSASGSLSVTDADSGQAQFAVPAALAGSYGAFTFNAATGAWTYALNNASASVQGLRAGQTVQDVLTVQSLDGTATQAITITVTGANDAATISGTSTGAVAEDGTLSASGSLSVTDVDSGQAQFAVPAALAGSYGSFTFNATTGAWTYALSNASSAVQGLRAGQTVQDVLTVQSLDGTATQAITITVTGANDAATISGTSTGAVAEDGTLSASGSLSVTDVDSGQAQFAVPASLAGSYGSFSFNATTGAWTYALNNASSAVQGLRAGQTVQDVLTVQSLDGTATQAITITVTGANDAATISGTRTGAVAEDGTLSASGSLSVTDVDSGQAQFAVPAALAGSYGSFTFNATTGAWTYALSNASSAVQGLRAGQTVQDVLTVQSLDGTATQAITITVTGANDAATISGTSTGAVAENGTLSASGSLSVTDADSGQAQFAVPASLAGSYGAFTFNATTGAWTYALSNASSAVQGLRAGQTVQDVLTVQSLDGTATQAITINVTGANNAATISGTRTGAVAEDGTLSASGSLTVTDADSGQAQFAAPAALAGSYGAFTFSATTGAWTYARNNALAAVQGLRAGQTVQDLLTVQSLDGTATQAITITVTGANDAPTANADSAQTVLNTGRNIEVLANDTDIDGGPLTVAAITQGSHGSVVIRPDGVSVRYTPSAGFSGFDSFTYTASDGAGGTATATVRVLTFSHSGTAASDFLLTTQQADFILAGDGNDRVLAYGGNDYVDGGRGADTLTGGLGADTLLGGDGADTFLTTEAELAGDSIDGGNGTDTLQITDPIVVMPADLTLVNVEQLSFSGSLQVVHTALLDLSALTLTGTGNLINGGTAASRIIGTRSNDRITDSAGNDDLRGADGNDTIQAGVGQDTVYGGRGNDTLMGATASTRDFTPDLFVFDTPLNAATNADTILGFEAGALDLIGLTSAIFSAVGGALEAGEFRASAGGLAADANDFILFDTTTGHLFYDADGSGAGARVLFAMLGTAYSGAVDAADFVVMSAPAPT